jgi:carboxyl-terminal processing protease
MNRRIAIWLPLLLAVVLSAGFFMGTRLSSSRLGARLSITPNSSSKLESIIQYIQNDYVDSVSGKELSEEAITALLKDLDPHSVYIPASEVSDANEPLEGGFSGIGVQFSMQTDTVYVINTVPNGPSAKLGILPGDKIIKVNDSVIAGKKLSTDKVVKMLKGPKGTKVRVAILRHGVKQLVDYTITRGEIPLYSVDYSYMLAPSVGYVKINQFARTTPAEFIKAVTKLHQQGMKKLVLDLRGNGGGLLDAAIAVADQFLDRGQLIVYTQGRMRPRQEARATEKGLCQSDKLVVLIDEYSASASEIVSGAIQDNDRGTIIGRRSFGKGLVQEQSEFPDGSAIRLTVARYYTPSGRCIQKPYSKGKGEEDYEMDILNRYNHGELVSKDSIHLDHSKKYTTVGGRVVYGGGGIMPDIFVPMDTAGYSMGYGKLRDQGLIYKFSFEFTDKYRDQMKAFKDVKSLRQWLAMQNVTSQFIAYAKTHKVELTAKDLRTSYRLLTVELEAYIARNMLDNDGFYPVIQEVDATLQRSINFLEKGK